MAPPFSKGSSKVSATLRKECQRSIAIHRFGKLFLETSKKKKELQSRLYRLFHGDGATAGDHGIIGGVDEFCQGIGPFSQMYEMDAGVPGANGTTFKRLIKVSYLCDDGAQNISVGKEDADITRSMIVVLNDKTPTLVSGRTLMKQAEEGVKNGKKALAFAMTILDSNGNLPSGANADDLIEHVLQSMWEEQHRITLDGYDAIDIMEDGDTVDDGGADEMPEDIPADDLLPTRPTHTAAGGDTRPLPPPRPSGWFFKGWFAFLLFGPLAANEYKSVVFETGDLRGDRTGGKGGRKEQRKVAKDEAASVDHSTTPGGANGPEIFSWRDISLDQKLSIAMVAQQHARSADQNHDNALFAFAEEITFHQKTVGMKLQAAQATMSTDAWQKYTDAQEDLDGRVKAYSELRATKRQRGESEFVGRFINSIVSSEDALLSVLSEEDSAIILASASSENDGDPDQRGEDETSREDDVVY